MSLWRVENPETLIGLWYNEFGEKTDFIKTIENAQCAEVPMEFDPQMKDGGDWFSACDNLPDMRNWFSTSDLHNFGQVGYRLYRIEVPNYRMANGHEDLGAIGDRDGVPADRLRWDRRFAGGDIIAYRVVSK